MHAYILAGNCRLKGYHDLALYLIYLWKLHSHTCMQHANARLILSMSSRVSQMLQSTSPFASADYSLFDATLFALSSLVLKFIKILVCRLYLPVIFFTTCSNFYLDFIIMLAEMLRNYEKFWRIIENTAVYSVFLSNNSHYNYSFNDTMSKQFNEMS